MQPSWASAWPRTQLDKLNAMYSSPGMFVLRADITYKPFRDLVGPSRAFAAKGSGLPILVGATCSRSGLK